jgi:hypothetical protein
MPAACTPLCLSMRFSTHGTMCGIKAGRGPGAVGNSATFTGAGWREPSFSPHSTDVGRGAIAGGEVVTAPPSQGATHSLRRVRGQGEGCGVERPTAVAAMRRPQLCRCAWPKVSQLRR